MDSLSRRDVLRRGAALSTVAVGGCLAGDEGEDASYYRWIPAAPSSILTAHIDLEISATSSEGDQLLPVILPTKDEVESADYVPRVTGLEDVDDPLLTVPIDVGGRLLATASLSFYVAGLDYLIDPEQPGDRASSLFLVNGVVVATGEVDVDRAVENLREGSPGPLSSFPFERSGDRGGFELFRSTTDSGEAVVAVDGSAVLIGEAREEVAALIDAGRGETPRALEANGRFGWLADAAGEGHLSVGWVGSPELASYAFGDPEAGIPDGIAPSRAALLSSIAFSRADTDVTARFATQGIDAATVGRLESALGTAAEDLAVDVEGERLSATGTYGGEVLDVAFDEPGSGTGSGDDRVDPDEEPPPAVADAVPDDAFRFEYTESQRRVDVHVETDLAVDSITVRTLESEWKTSVSPVESGTFVSVYLAPEGDTVVVQATVDGETGVVAHREYG